MTRFVLTLIAVGGLTLSVGCKSDCEKAYDNLMSIMEKEIEGMPKEAQEAAKKGLESAQGEKDKTMEQCEKQDPAEIKCAIEAKSMADLGKCASKEKK